jgi:hypothetical protein
MRGDRHGLPVCAGLLTLAVGRVLCQTAAGPDTSVEAIVGAAAAYVSDYEQQLTSVLSDETYSQLIRDQMPRDPAMPQGRTMKSETFFMFAAASREWLAIRDVISVDGSPVPDRPDIRAQLQEIPTAQVGATLKNYNSRFNIGRSFRNFNEPTLSLLVLDSKYRSNFRFERKHVRGNGDAALVTVGFTESATGPTLIRDLLLRPSPASGDLIVEARTGRIRQAHLDVVVNEVAVKLTTTYATDPKLQMLVPVLFRESYVRTVAGDYEEIFCEAKYSNYRRFEVTTRVKIK